MKKHRGTVWNSVPYFATLLCFVLVCAGVYFGVHDAGRVADEEGLRIAAEGVRRACVTCYATEGRYAPNFAYLEQYYGARVDQTRYAVHYEVFAENIMPEITITQRREVGT